jgi:hypothetical protein
MSLAKSRFLPQYGLTNYHYFVLTFMLFVVYLFNSGYNELYYDSGKYWSHANSFDLNGRGNFSIYNYNSSLRGYILPLLHYPLVLIPRFGHPSAIKLIKIVNSMQAGLLFGVVCPEVWKTITHSRLQSWQRLSFIAVCFVLWKDHFNFLLSDFPAVLGLLVAILFTYKNKKPWHVLLAGASIGFAVYTRPIYIVSVPFIVLLLLYNKSTNYNSTINRSEKLLSSLLFSLAFFLIGLPQYLINKENYNSSSFFVLAVNDGASYTIQGKKDLYLWHVVNGLSIQRYETSISADNASDGKIFYKDTTGIMLATEYKGRVTSYEAYLAILIEKPFELGALYSRHLFNGLDVLYSSPYVRDLYAPTVWTSLLNYTVLFVATITILLRLRRLKAQHISLLASFALPCIASIPTIMECRFLLPLHLALSALCCYSWSFNWSRRVLYTIKTPSVIIAYILFLAICFHLSSNTQAMLETGL